MLGASAFRTGVPAVLLVLLPAAAPLASQTWNDARTRALVERATARRAAQIADTTLASYTATATGYLTFLGQMGEGMTEPPKVIRADQLALQVYWRAPDLSKQEIVGRRDTAIFPADLHYHRDHLGIVQNNFPSIIRLGEGDEVRDVPHPLSALGLTAYDFAISDSVRIRLPGRAIDVYQIDVRPRDASQPRFVGALFVDTASAQVVRMSFSFTRAAYLDRQLEDISIVLENALVRQRYWLPYRQEVEIRRTGRMLDFPVRGIIRGRWEICCYDVGVALPASLFIGPEVVDAPAARRARYPWTGRILDSLPEGAVIAGEADLERVQERAATLVTAGALAPRETASLSAHRLSDFARVNRVEGLALGAGATWHATPVLALGVLARFGFADHLVKARLSAAWTIAPGRSLAPYVERAYREAGDFAERSLVVNSVAAQEYGSDLTDPYLVRAVGVRAALGRWLGLRWSAEASYEREESLSVHATPFSHAYGPTLPAWPLREERIGLDADGTWRPARESSLRVHASLRGGWTTREDTTIASAPGSFARGFVEARFAERFGARELVLRTTLAAVSPAGAPPQEQVLLGGPISGPGYDFHQFAAAFGASQHVEWRTPLPFPAIRLGAFGRTPAHFTLAPYAHVVYVDRTADFARPAEGWYPSLGVGASFFFDLVRVDVARGLRGGTWTFGVDLAHDLWSIL